MDVFEALYTTRAMRRVSEDPIPDDVLKQMVDAGIRAPSGSNRQGWKFIVVTAVSYTHLTLPTICSV